MNGKNVTQETDDGTKYTEYQYDYNEFRGVDGQNFNTEKIKESPSDYLEFSVPEQNVVGPVPVPTIKAMQSQIDSLESVVADLIGGAE